MMIAQEIIPIYMACDDNYAMHLSVVIASAVDNTSSKLHFIVMASALLEENKAKILKAAQGHLVDFVDMQKELGFFNDVKYASSHISIETCLRYFIPNLDFPYEKAIYLDCDVIVLEDIAQLYNFDLADNYIAGAFDTVKAKYVKKLGLEKYFNAGVLLLNLKKLKEDNLADVFLEKTLELKDKIKYLDQDILNLYTRAKSLFLDLKWGLVSPFFRRKVKSKFFTQEMSKEAIYSPCLVHFTGPDKPWNIPFGLLAHPYTPAYFYYLNKTEFKGEAKNIFAKFSPYKTLFNYFKRHLLFFLRLQFYKMRILYTRNKKKYYVEK